jgi:methanogenic corrinoid protein MtbC1
MIDPAMGRTSSEPVDRAGMLSIGALARATGVPVETLRTWEVRYGFPAADRRPSGHRVYPLTTVARVRRMSAAIAQGHRAGEVVPATDAALDRLLAVAQVALPALASSLPPVESVDALLQFVSRFDGDRLTATLMTDWARMTPVAFVQDRLAPLVRAVGERWAAGRFEIRHEHFLSERLGDLLRSLRLTFDLRATGPVVVCATLPGEAHGIGLQMVALVFAAAGWRVTYLGTETPVAELVTAARELPARALALSISSAAKPDAVRAQLAQLRRAMPKATVLLAGGAGAPAARGITRLGDAAELDAWARRTAEGR